MARKPDSRTSHVQTKVSATLRQRLEQEAEHLEIPLSTHVAALLEASQPLKISSK